MTVKEIVFKNRNEAGAQLAGKLLGYKMQNPLVLALPRGGVPVGYEVASKIKAPLDTIVARKIGAPFNPEFGVGAIAPGLRHADPRYAEGSGEARAGYGHAEAGDVVVLDNVSIQSLGLQRKDLDPIIKEETEEMNQRIARYKSGEYSKNNRAETVIIVDDGLATGVTARAAIESAKITLRPKKIIFASPICASDTAEHLRGLVDEVVCVGEVPNLTAIGYWYEEFNQTTDEEVVYYLEKANNLIRSTQL